MKIKDKLKNQEQNPHEKSGEQYFCSTETSLYNEDNLARDVSNHESS